VKIERAVLREIGMHLREPFRTHRGTVHVRRVVLVTLFAEGCEGWGECVAGVDASSPETVDGSWMALERVLLPGAVGRHAGRPEESVDAVGAGPMARAAVEMAAWDLAARLEGVSLARKLGGTQKSVPVGASVGLQSDDAHLIDVVARHLEETYARVKVKIEPGREVAMLAALRARFPTARLWADANAGYTLDDLETLRRLDAFGLELLEQPLAVDDLNGHARLQKAIETPLCLDESIVSETAARRALEAGACRVVNLKPGRLGGHAESIRVHDLCRAGGVPVWCGGMLETGVGRAHNLALASLPGFTLPGDISASRRYWERDVVVPEFEVVNGSMAVPTGPGIGVQVDEDYLRAVTVREKVIE
jgi:O-succinylbenzoate synthase